MEKTREGHCEKGGGFIITNDLPAPRHCIIMIRIIMGLDGFFNFDYCFS